MKTLDLRWNRWRRQWELPVPAPSVRRCTKAPKPEKPQKPRTNWFAVLLGFLCGWMMFFVVVLAPIPARAQSAPPNDLMAVAEAVYTLCERQMHESTREANALCEAAARMQYGIQRMANYCFGRKDQDRSEWTWHRCTVMSMGGPYGPTPTIVRGAGIMNEFLHVEMQLGSICDSSTNDVVKRDVICTYRDRLTTALVKRGYCYRMKGQTGPATADMRWHKCTRESLR